MTNKPISNTNLKRILPKNIKVFGLSKNKILNINSSYNQTIKAISHPKNYLNKCLGMEIF